MKLNLFAVFGIPSKEMTSNMVPEVKLAAHPHHTELRTTKDKSKLVKKSKNYLQVFPPR